MTLPDPPTAVGSNDGLGLAPEREGQPRMMTIISNGNEHDDEAGHWYSPAAVRELLAAERERCARIVKLANLRCGFERIGSKKVGRYDISMINDIESGAPPKA